MINFDINNVNAASNVEHFQEVKENSPDLILEDPKDVFEKQTANKTDNQKSVLITDKNKLDTPPEDKSQNGEFDVSEAAKNFGKVL